MKNNISKKFILTFLLTTIFFIGSNTKAISQFPNKITVSVGNLMPDSFRIFKKEYTGSDGSSGKAFCSSFWNDIYNNTCSKTYYHSDPLTNEKAQAAVGAIINSSRNSDGSMSWNKYYYTELAINDFLYKNVTNNQVNNLNRYGSFPYSKRKIIQPKVDLAKNVFNSYKSEVVTIDNLKINGILINENSKDLTSRLENTKNYIITADMKCYNDNSKTNQVACSNPDAVIKAKNNSGEIESYTVTKNYNGNTLNLEADISSLINGNSSELQNIELSLNAESKKTYYLAQRYYCGNYLQTMTPNLLKPSTVTAKVSATGKFLIIPKEKSCGDEISPLTQFNLGYAVTNANLYSTKYNNYGMLLDINNPSCSPTSSSHLISCDVENGNSAVVNSKKVIHGNIPNQSGEYDYLCTITFSYDSDTMMNKNISSANKLIYQKNDGIIGRAKVNYDCNVPALTYAGNDSLKEFDLNNIAPKLKIKLDNTEEYEMDYKIESVSSSSSECTLDNNKITCKNYKTNKLGYGWNFEADVVYYYPESLNYSMDAMGNIKKTNGCSNCSKIGYGIHVPENTEISSNTVSHLSTVKFDFPSDYKVDNSNLNVSCPYTINKIGNVHKEILYRTIDADNPFESYTGKDRLTGSNWCSNSGVDNFDDYDDFGIDNTQIISDASTDKTVDKSNPRKCIYRGDMNKNGEWDNNDVDIIQKYIADEYQLNSDELINADVNYDGRVDIGDVFTIQLAMRTFANTLKGDLNSNGIIDLDDVSIVQYYSAESIKLTEVKKKLADMDNDCSVNIVDVTALQKIITGVASSEITESSYQGDISDDDVYATLNDIINELRNDERTKKCANNNDKVTSIIKNRPNANGDFVIKDDDGIINKKKAKTPLYRFVITPDNIKNIRSDNKEHKGYSSFDSVCDEDGKKCVSTFISQASDNGYVSNISGLCAIGTYCDITNVIQENYIKGGA